MGWGQWPHSPFVGQASQVFGCGGRGGMGWGRFPPPTHAKQLPPTVGRVAFEPLANEGATFPFSELSFDEMGLDGMGKGPTILEPSLNFKNLKILLLTIGPLRAGCQYTCFFLFAKYQHNDDHHFFC